jgi:methionine-gamma-lyase
LRIPHLALRVTEHARRAETFAERLQELGVPVSYPGLPDHPDFELMKQLRCEDYGFGGILTLDLGTEQKANNLMDVLQNKYGFGFMAVSLGYFDTLMSCPGSSTSSEMTNEDMSSAGIGEGLVRISVGYTGTVEQRWQQLESALSDIGASRVRLPEAV